MGTQLKLICQQCRSRVSRESTRRELLGFEVVTGIERDAPFWRQVHAAVEAERLRDARGEAGFRIAEAVVESEVPRDVEVVVFR